MGGAGLVNIYDYLWAVRLDIEKSSAPTEELKSLLLEYTWSPWNLSTISPPMQSSLKAWRFLLSQKQTEVHEINYRLPLLILEAKIPMLSVKGLVDQGIMHISDLYNSPLLKTSEQIMPQYQLPSNMLFTCLRITHFLQRQSSPQISLPPKAWQFILTTKLEGKGISLFYNLIGNKLTFTKTIAMGKWEDDLGTTFSDDQWQYAFREIHKASHCVKHWELAIKMANRWQYTPYRMDNYFPGTSA